LGRLTFSNVPTKSGGVISGNVSTGAGSPFGSGGKYESQIANIKAEIAKKPVGYYDPAPNTLWKGENIEIEFEGLPAVINARKKILQLYKVYDPFHPLASSLGRYGTAGDKFAHEQLILQQEKIIDDIHTNLLAEKNAPVIKAQLEQQAIEADLQRHLEIELAVQQALEKQLINQRPTPTPEFVITDPISPVSYLPFAVVGIVLVVILLILRRKA